MSETEAPILGLIRRGGQVGPRMLANVQQATIKPIVKAAGADGTLIHTDEYSVYARLPAWGYGHKTACLARGEYACDGDGDGFCKVHANMMEDLWSLLRSWLRPYWNILQDKLPLYLGFCQFVHNAHRRGKALLGPSSPAWSRDPPGSTPEPDKSLRQKLLAPLAHQIARLRIRLATS